MHNTVQLITASQKDRLILESVFKNLGADAVFSQDLNDALSVFEKTRPRAVFVVDGEDPPAEIQIREIARVAPFMPIVVLIKQRDASKAVAYMKAGAFDCAQSPWTEEEIRPVYKKALNMSGTTLRLDRGQFEKQKTVLLLTGLLISLIFGFTGGWFYGFNKYRTETRPLETLELPYSHPSGLAFDKDRILISDWYTQALYAHDMKDLKITGVAAFPNTVPVGLAAGEPGVWLATAGGDIEKRMNNGKFTVLSKTKPGAAPPAGVCYDGLYLWLAWPGENKISKRLANDELTELKTFKYPGKTITAFSCDARSLWVADEGLRSLVKLSPDDPQTALSKTEIGQYSSKTLKITALAPKGGKIWFTAEDNGKGRLFSIDEPR
ncbi:MAG: response regulator [Elusimicrobia bacterium]|nr:response regulator [Elusimicrobiota bacterium]